MTKRKDYLAVLTMMLMIITSLVGILSFNFNHAYEFINQYGDPVTIYGYGIYSFDTCLQAATSIGTDLTILFILVPMFLYTYLLYRKSNDSITELKLISLYTVALYYAASIAFGLTYNQLFLIYLALFVCTLFGTFKHIKNINWDKKIQVTNGMKVFLILCGAALIVAWLPDVISSLIKGASLDIIGIYTTCITYILDMGIISPLCFVGLYLLIKKEPLGTLILAVLLKLCIIVGIMMIPQTVCQIALGVNIPLPALLTKVLSFVILCGFAFYFNKKMYRELTNLNI